MERRDDKQIAFSVPTNDSLGCKVYRKLHEAKQDIMIHPHQAVSFVIVDLSDSTRPRPEACMQHVIVEHTNTHTTTK